MPSRAIVLPLAGFVLYVLLSTFVGNRAKYLFLHDPEAFVIISIHGFRSAMDTLILALVWVIVTPALNIPKNTPLFGTIVPLGYVYAGLFAVFFWLNFKVRLFLARH